MQKESMSPIRIGFTYIGVVVGAGFASGQEIFRFFNVFGAGGFIGIIISTFLFWILGYQILKLGHKINASSYMDVVDHFSGRNTSKVFDFILTFFLFGTFAAMLSGAGAIANQYFGLEAILGGVLMAIISAITVVLGIKKVINSISFVVPFLILTVTYICLQSHINTGRFVSVQSNWVGISGNWFTSALLYVFYNLTFAIAVLAPLGAQAKNTKSLFYGSFIGAIGLGLGSMLIFLTINSDLNNLLSLEIPMLYFAKKISEFVSILFLLVLIAEIFTTAVGNLYGIVARFTSRSHYTTLYTTLFISILACIASLLGFSNLVAYLYPIMGYAGICLFALAIFRKVFK